GRPQHGVREGRRGAAAAHRHAVGVGERLALLHPDLGRPLVAHEVEVVGGVAVIAEALRVLLVEGRVAVADVVVPHHGGQVARHVAERRVGKGEVYWWAGGIRGRDAAGWEGHKPRAPPLESFRYVAKPVSTAWFETRCGPHPLLRQTTPPPAASLPSQNTES